MAVALETQTVNQFLCFLRFGKEGARGEGTCLKMFFSHFLFCERYSQIATAAHLLGVAIFQDCFSLLARLNNL